MKNITRLLVADTHFTDKPADEYRWELFPWLKQQALKFEVDEIDFLGDLTDSKEGHKAEFVNRLSEALADLAAVVPCKILEGNHDRKLRKQPFFKFLDLIPNVTWIEEPEAFDDALFLPHTHTPDKDWIDLVPEFDKFNFVFMHQCFMGAKSSLGFELEGAHATFGDLKRVKIYAGDIHLPQQVGQVEYVGSPYPVHFGDRFLGRCIVTDSTQWRRAIHIPTIEKFTAEIVSLDELEQLSLSEGDQIKVRYKIKSEDRDRWPEIKEAIKTICQDLGVQLHGIELISGSKDKQRMKDSRTRLNKLAPEQALRAYAVNEKLAESYVSTGLELLGESK